MHSALAGYQENSCLIMSSSSGKVELREFSKIVTDHRIGIVTPPYAEHGTVPCSAYGGQG